MWGNRPIRKDIPKFIYPNTMDEDYQATARGWEIPLFGTQPSQNLQEVVIPLRNLVDTVTSSEDVDNIIKNILNDFNPLKEFQKDNIYQPGQIKPLAMRLDANRKQLFVFYQQNSVIDIINVQNPDFPIKLKTFQPGWAGFLQNANDMIVDDGILYFAQTSNGRVRAIDVQNLNNIIIGNDVPCGSGPFGIIKYGNYIYVANSGGAGGVSIHDASTLALTKVNEISGIGVTGRVKVVRDFLFVTCYNTHLLKVYDLKQNPTNPVEVGSISVGTMPVWLNHDYKMNNNIIVGEYSANNFYIVNFDDVENMTLLSTTNNGGIVRNFHYIEQDRLAVMGAGTNSRPSCSIYDISDLSQPSLITVLFGITGGNLTNNEGSALVSNVLYWGHHNVAAIRLLKINYPILSKNYVFDLTGNNVSPPTVIGEGYINELANLFMDQSGSITFNLEE